MRLSSGRLIPVFVLLLAATFWSATVSAEDAGKAPARLGIGILESVAVGADGFDPMPGLIVQIYRVPVAIRIASADDAIRLGLSADRIILDSSVAGRDLNWYVGAGAYGGMRWAESAATAFTLGARALAGLRFAINGNFEIFLSFVPAAGVRLGGAAPAFDWDLAMEFGFRSLF